MTVVGSGAVEIKLNQGFVALVDSDDLEILAQYNWNASKSRNTHYACTVGDGPRILTMHRYLIQPPKNLLVDHINGDGLDNRRCNLQLVNHRDNASNNVKRRSGETSSKYKGVWYDSSRRRKPWRACMRVNGRTCHIGSFSTEEEAAKAYVGAIATLP